MNVGEVGHLSKRQGISATGVLIVVALLAVAIDVAVSFMLRPDLPPRTAGFLVFLTLLGNVAVILTVFRTVTKLDEFKKRVHLEAVLFAFLTTLLAILVFCFLRVAQLVGSLHGSHVLWFMIVSYGFGYVLALRRYR